MAINNINTFITDRVLRFNMMNQGNRSELFWSLTQVTDPSLTFETESQEITDAIGNTVANIDKSKKGTFSGSNAFFDMSLFAAQHGTEKVTGSASSKIVTPCFEIITATDSDNDGTMDLVTLGHTPSNDAEIKAIYALNGDDTLSTKITRDTSAGAGKFALSADSLTLPTDTVAGNEYFIQYEYEAESGVSVTAKATEFPKAGYGIMEVLGFDVCNQSEKIYAYWIFPNAKLKSDAELSFASDAQTHPFTIDLRQEYCDREKVLAKLVIPEQ